MLTTHSFGASGEADAAFLPFLNVEKRMFLSGGAIVVSVSFLLALGVVYCLRGGLGDNFGAVLVLGACALLPVWLPIWLLNRYSATALQSGASCVTGIFAGTLLPLLGLAGGRYAGWLITAMLVGALAANVSLIRRAARAIGFKSLLTILAAALLLLLHLGPRRLFLPEAMTAGIASSDSYFHAAIAQMILRFGIPSLGADGLAFHHYHTLSHALAAGQAGASEARVPAVYLYWGGLALKAQLIWCFYGCLVLFAPQTQRSAGSAVALGLGYAWLAAILVAGLESEAFVLSLILLSAVLPLLVALLKAGDREAALPVGVALACLAAMVCAGAKVSAGFFVAICLLVVAWNLRRRWVLVAGIAAALVVLVAVIRLALAPRDLSMANTSAMVILGSYLQYLVPETIFSYALPVGFIVLLLRAPGSDSDFLQAPRAVRWFLRADNLAKFLILIMAGCVAVLFSSAIGSNMQYFSAIPYAIALLLLPALLHHTPVADTAHRWSPAVVATLLAGALMPLLSTLPLDSFNMVVDLYKKTEQQNSHIRISEDVKASLRQTNTPFALLHQRIAATPWAVFTRAVESENFRSGGKLAVEIEPSAQDIWERLKGGSAWWCMAPHLMIPAETGLYQFRSVPPKRIEKICAPPGIVWYGFGDNQDLHRTTRLEDTQLCALAWPAGIREIYRLRSYRNLSKNSITRCG